MNALETFIHTHLPVEGVRKWIEDRAAIRDLEESGHGWPAIEKSGLFNDDMTMAASVPLTTPMTQIPAGVSVPHNNHLHESSQQTDEQAATASWQRDLGESYMQERASTEIEPDYAALSETMFAKMRTESTTTLGMDDEGRLHRDPREGAAEVIDRHEDWGGGHGQRETTERYIVHGEEVARVEITSSNDEESSNYREEWRDAKGELHSFNGNPAVINESSHQIPSETYLDDSSKEFYSHGQFINSVDSTYDDVVSSKGLSLEALQSFGYDPDTDHKPEPKVEYGNRFDQPPVAADYHHPRSPSLDATALMADMTLDQIFAEDKAEMAQSHPIDRLRGNATSAELATSQPTLSDDGKGQPDLFNKTVLSYPPESRGPSGYKPTESAQYQAEQTFYGKYSPTMSQQQRDAGRVATAERQSAQSGLFGAMERQQEKGIEL